MKRLLTEPLFHFLLLGIGLFLMYGWLQGGLLGSPEEILVSRARSSAFGCSSSAPGGEPPTEKELQ